MHQNCDIAHVVIDAVDDEGGDDRHGNVGRWPAPCRSDTKVKKEMKQVATRRRRRNAKYIEQLHERFDEKFKEEDGEEDDWTPPVQPSYLLQQRAEKRESMYRSSIGRSNVERVDG